MSSIDVQLKSLGIDYQNAKSSNFSKDFVYKVKKGMGITIGNSLRRILLGHIEGYAIRSVLINGVSHEFSSSSGIKESMQNLIMNLRKIVFKGEEKNVQAFLNIKNMSGEVFASSVQVSNAEIVNPHLYLCTVQDKAELQVEMIVEKNIGHILASKVNIMEYESFSIICDAFFSPIINVNFEIEDIENNIKEEELVISIVTNGSITPETALDNAIIIWRDEMAKLSNRVLDSVATQVNNNYDNQFEQKVVHSVYLSKEITKIDLSARVVTCLQALNIKYVGEVVQMTESVLLNEPNFGQGSLNDLNRVLNNMNLKLGMVINDWQPPTEKENNDIFIR